MVRRECFEKTGMFNESRKSCQDFDLWTRMPVDGVEFDYVDQPLTMYRIGHASMISDQSRHYREHQIVLRELFDGIGHDVCTSRMKRTAWAFYFAKCAHVYCERNNRWRALVDSIRSIYYRPFGVVDGMAWRVLAKSLLPRTVIGVLRLRRNVT
jgi:hypothetical protein